jgi:hypothetical protein
VRGAEASLLYARGPASAWASLALNHGHGRGLVSGEEVFTAAERAFLAGHAIRLPDVQTVTASGGAAYRFGRLRLSGDFLYGSGLPRSALFAGETRRLPAAMRIDAAAVARLGGLNHHPFDLRLDLVNLLDRRQPIRDADPGRRFAEYSQSRGVFVGIEQGF